MTQWPGLVLDGVIIVVMAALVATGKCEMSQFLTVVGPIVGIRVWQAKNGGPPPNAGMLASSAVIVVFLLPLAHLLTMHVGKHSA